MPHCDDDQCLDPCRRKGSAMTTIATEKLTDTVGAMVVGVDADRCSRTTRSPDWCLDALEEHGALVFRDLHSTTPPRSPSASGSDGWRSSAKGEHPEIFRVTLDPTKNRAAAYLKGTFDWHIDGMTEDIPIMATLLSARAVADVRRRDRVRQHLCRLRRPDRRREGAVPLACGWSTRSRRPSAASTPTPRPRSSAMWRSRPAKEHPLDLAAPVGSSLPRARRHDRPRGRHGARRGPGLPRRPARPGRRRPSGCTATTWAVGDLVIWDNRGVLHRPARTTRPRPATCTARRSSATSRSSEWPDAGRDRPRIDPLPPDQWPEEMREALAALRPAEPPPPVPAAGPGRPKGLNVLGTLAQHPALATRVPHVQRPRPVRDHALAAPARAARPAGRRRAGVRVRVGAAPGAGRRRRARPTTRSSASPRVRTPPAGRRSTGRWSARSTSCSATPGIGDATWAALAAELDEQQLMDLVFTVGAYDVLAMAMRSLRRAARRRPGPLSTETLFSFAEIGAIVRRTHRTEDETAWRTSPSPPRAAGPSTPGLDTGPVSYEDSISPEHYELERDAIFRRTWLNVGRVEQLPRNGSYFTRELDAARTSVIVVRDRRRRRSGPSTTSAATGATSWCGTTSPARRPAASAASSPASTTAGATTSRASSPSSSRRRSSSTSTRRDFGLVAGPGRGVGGVHLREPRPREHDAAARVPGQARAPASRATRSTR